MGRLHPRNGIEYEMRMMPLGWVTKRRCIEFYVDKSVENKGN